jgi:hypothetical protein
MTSKQPTQTELLSQVVTKLDTIIIQLDSILNYKPSGVSEDIEEEIVSLNKQDTPDWINNLDPPDFELIDDTNTHDYSSLFGNLK